MAEFEPIVGRYLPVRFDGLNYRIFIEEAGGGVPLLCLHTAACLFDVDAIVYSIERSGHVAANNRFEFSQGWPPCHA